MLKNSCENIERICIPFNSFGRRSNSHSEQTRESWVGCILYLLLPLLLRARRVLVHSFSSPALFCRDYSVRERLRQWRRLQQFYWPVRVLVRLLWRLLWDLPFVYAVLSIFEPCYDSHSIASAFTISLLLFLVLCVIVMLVYKYSNERIVFTLFKLKYAALSIV